MYENSKNIPRFLKTSKKEFVEMSILQCEHCKKPIQPQTMSYEVIREDGSEQGVYKYLHTHCHLAYRKEENHSPFDIIEESLVPY
jgi:hypothetical protein